MISFGCNAEIWIIMKHNSPEIFNFWKVNVWTQENSFNTRPTVQHDGAFPNFSSIVHCYCEFLKYFDFPQVQAIEELFADFSEIVYNSTVFL